MGFARLYPSQGLSDRSPPPRRMDRAERNPSLLHQLSNLVDSPGGEVVVSSLSRYIGREEIMAAKKAKPAPATPAATPKVVVEQRVVRQITVVATAGSDSNRLLREAAWSRMFGRVESKNPFAR